MADFPNNYVAGAAYSSLRNRPFINNYVSGGASSTVYYQRVWDTALAAWCYYRKALVDPTPLPGETSPNHTGSITNHNVVQVE
jgi:hypothetical protein